MTVNELIDDMTKNTFHNEKEYELTVKDPDGVEYSISYYDWCDQILVLKKKEK